MKARNEQKKRRGGRTAARAGALLLAFLMLAARPAAARADYSPAAEEDAAESTETPEYEPQSGAVVGETGGQPFPVAGNGTVTGDAADDGTKEFFTVRTKNNQTFFLVVDRAGTADNAYMLSMVDEDDLREFLEEENRTGLFLPQEEEQAQEDARQEEEREKAAEDERRKAETRKNTWLFVLLLAAAGAVFCGGYYYLRIYRPGKEEEDAPDEHLEDAGYGPYETEDEEPDDDGGQEAREPEPGGRNHGGENTEETEEDGE